MPLDSEPPLGQTIGLDRRRGIERTAGLRGERGTMSTLAVVEQVLRETGTPMSVRQIVEHAGDALPTRSKTPDTVVARDLSIDIKNKGETSDFVRTAPGRYTLRALVAQPAAEPSDIIPVLKDSLPRERSGTRAAASEGSARPRIGRRFRHPPEGGAAAEGGGRGAGQSLPERLFSFRF